MARSVSFSIPSLVTGTVNISVSVSTGVSQVKFLVDGVERRWDNTAPFTYAMDSKTLKDGTHTMVVKARDAVGWFESAPKTFKVQNTTPVPTSTSPSGQDMPTWATDGFKAPTFKEDFTRACSPGQFATVYDDTMDYYPEPWLDTSQRGMYTPRFMYASNSVLHIPIGGDVGRDGKLRVAAPVPKIVPTVSGDTNSSTDWNDVLYGRFTVRWRCPKALPGYKVAWLLWPQSNVWPRDSEMDLPECDLAVGKTIGGFLHKADATQGSDQYWAGSTVPSSGAAWHTTTLEWRQGYARYVLDGKTIGGPWTSRIPYKPMHWVLQTETILNRSTAIDRTVKGEIEIDWITYQPVA